MVDYFECKHCLKLLKSEKAFINHYCEEAKRHDLLTTAKGQLGFEIYSRWVYIRYSQKPDRDMFKRSKFFHSFIKFAKYYKAIGGLYDLDEFLLFMIKKQILPYSWLDNKVISYYLVAMDMIDPKSKIERSVEFILKISDKMDCDTSEIFDYFNAELLLDAVKMHKISPWILLNSSVFFKWMETCLNFEIDLINEFIDVDVWSERFEKNEKYVKLSRKYCKALGI